MRRINVTVTDEAGSMLDEYKALRKNKSLDDAVDGLLKEVKEKKVFE